ncbi:MAG: zinc dependent phospholipase C family protein, partial [Lachnospiraceae bacterium]|nr:zinc dependent phospholipase C family protein [Lachnospiraceae bacterium]
NPLCHNKVGKCGTRIHEESGKTFFLNAARTIHKCNNKEAHQAYIYGYLCHFALDYVCHGFVGEQMEVTGLSHYEIEAEYDRRLLLMDGYENPVEVCVTKHLHPSVKNAEIIADFYEDISIKQTLQSLKGMIFFLNLLRAPSVKKRKFIYGAMKAAGMYKSMRGLVMNYEENPLCAATTDEMVRRFPKAVQLAVELIVEYERYLYQGGTLSETFSYNFESQLLRE